MSEPDDLPCNELVELVTEYIEGTVPPRDRARFELHLAVCPGCAEYLAQMRETIRGAGSLPERSLSPEATAAFLDLLRTWKRGR